MFFLSPSPSFYPFFLFYCIFISLSPLLLINLPHLSLVFFFSLSFCLMFLFISLTYLILQLQHSLLLSFFISFSLHQSRHISLSFRLSHSFWVFFLSACLKVSSTLLVSFSVCIVVLFSLFSISLSFCLYFFLILFLSALFFISLSSPRSQCTLVSWLFNNIAKTN